MSKVIFGFDDKKVKKLKNKKNIFGVKITLNALIIKSIN